MLAVSWVNSQIVFDGVVQGLAISVIAVGVVLVYRATRIINFAVGNMGVVGAALLSLLVVQYHVPFWVGLVVALLVGLAFGAIVDLAIIRRLRKSPRVVVLVATIGVSQLAAAIAIKIPVPTTLGVHYPSALSGMWTVAGVDVRGSDISILIIVPITLIALTWFLDRTTLGRTVKACASNPRLARLSSISPKMVSTMVWALAAGLSTLSVVLIAGQSGAAGDLTTLGPQTLSLALVAAVIGGMTSFRRTIIASVLIGLAQSIVNFNFIEEPGLINLLLLITVVVAVLFNRERTDESEVFAFTPRARPIPVRLRSFRWARNVNKSGVFLLAVIAIVLPLIFTQPSTQQTFTEVLAFAICATSLTVLTGWLGQLSLGQMAFAGLGALFAARLVEGGVPFWLAIVATTAGSAVLATILGLSSLRVKGLYLAVVTFVFALAAQQYFFSLHILSGASSDGSDLPFIPGKLFSLSFPGQRTYYYVVLVILAVVLLVASRFRDSGIGRSIMAVRDNENAAAAYRVRPAWEKIRAFAIAGALAGLGGAPAQRRLRQRRLRRPRELLRGGRVVEPGRHGGHRWDGLGDGGGHRRDLGHRDPRVGPQQRGPRAAHVEHRVVGGAALLPPRAHADRLRRAGRVLGLGGQAFRQRGRPRRRERTGPDGPSRARAPRGRHPDARRRRSRGHASAATRPSTASRSAWARARSSA